MPISSSVAPPSQPLRVLFYLFFPGGGIARYTHELLKHMNSTDELNVELVCLPTYRWLAKATYPVSPVLRAIEHRISWRRKARFLVAQITNPHRLCRRIRSTDADVVHLCNINHLTFPIWKGPFTKTGAKVVATVHDVRRASGILNRRFEASQLQRFYRWADGLFVHSRAQAEDLAAFADVDKAKIHIVPHGPYDYGGPAGERDELRERYGLPRNKQIALFFGNIRDEKNLDLLLRILPRFQDQLHLVVAGRAGAKGHRRTSDYRRLTQALSLEKSVTFFDHYVPDEAVSDFFELCDWVALPYSGTFTSQSGVLNVAMWYRRPVLISSAPTFEETLRPFDIGVMVEPDDPAALTSGIRSIQSRVRNAYVHKFDRYLSAFGWRENVARTVAVYRSLANGKHGCSTPSRISQESCR